MKTHRKLSRPIMISVLAAGLVGAACGAALAGRPSGKWFWFDGNSNTFIGSPRDPSYQPNSMLVQVAGDLNMAAGHFRFGSSDGNYEFEHGAGVPYTRLNSYFIGTPNRTPVAVGGNDGQDVLSLLVQGKAGQSHDLQQWESGTNIPTAINGDGNLRLGDVVLLATIVNGHVELVAQLPDGSTQVLAVGSPN